MGRVTGADISKVVGEYNVAVCAEIKAKSDGDLAAWQAAREEQERLRARLEWLKDQMHGFGEEAR